MATKQYAVETAQEFVRAILAKGFPLKKAILFGSFSRNQQGPWSDIDIALVADDFTGVGYFDLHYFADVKVSDSKFTPIETHTFSTDYFEKGDPFIAEIVKSGIVLA